MVSKDCYIAHEAPHVSSMVHASQFDFISRVSLVACMQVQRAGLDRMKQLVMRAVGAGGGGGGLQVTGSGGAAGSAAPFLIQGTGSHGMTTIL